jgi:anti-sigma regulatory factor (Ser/Thr protein kinase)
LSEIEDYVRVDIYHIEDGMANGSAAADVVHLLAELIENATHFSPPHTQVTVVGQLVREGYRIRVIDQGVGMTHRELNFANERILQAARGRADAKLLGLYVVGRLATRRGIEVKLEPSATRGITATVLVPASVMASRVDGAPPRPASVRRIPPVPTGAGSGRTGTGRTGTGRAGTGQAGTGQAGTGPGASRPGMPIRVRGAQLVGLDLGESAPGPDFDPAPERSRLNLRRLQLDVDAARRVIDGRGTTDHDRNREGE